MNPCKPGRLIGASLGPGDPALITRRAWAALGSGARWAYPVKKAEESSYALGIVRRGGLEVPADAEALVFPMTRDPVALARDLGTFRGLGYEAARIDAFDLFPHSHHVEAVAVLRATGAAAR